MSHQPGDVLAAMQSLCNERGIPFAVFYRREPPPLADDVTLSRQEQGRSAAPTWTDAGVVADFPSLSWPIDEHFTPQGNATYAQQVAPVFQAMLEELARRRGDQP